MSLDALGLLRLDQSGDESNIRLALLWNELLDKAEQSPMAVLGLLDILSARRVQIASNSEFLIPLIARSIRLAQNIMPASELMSFLLMLVGKFPSQALPPKLLSNIRRAVAEVTGAKPELVFDLLTTESKPTSVEAPIVSAGFGDGLASARQVEFQKILEIPERYLIRLLAHSSGFAKYVIDGTSKLPGSMWMAPLLGCLEYPDSELRRKARRRIVPALSVAGQVPILRACLRGVGVSSLAAVVRAIGAQTGFSVDEFDEPLCTAAKGESGIGAVRFAIFDAPETIGSNRFLARTIRAYPRDIWWILDEKSITFQRKGEILKYAFAFATPDDLRALANDSRAVQRVGEAIADQMSFIAPTYAHLLQLTELPVDFLLDRSAKLMPYLEKGQQGELLEAALTRGFAKASLSADSVMNRLLESTAGGLVTPQKLVAIAVPMHAGADRASNNVVMLDKSTRAVRDGLLSYIDELSDRLIRRYGASLSSAAIVAWAALLLDSGTRNPAAQLRAASSTLSFALSNLHSPVSSLVVSAFPIVDAELSTERETPNLLSFFFIDWDRCKTARKDLIRAFIASSWPPSDLIRSVLPTGDLPVVLRMLLNEPQGEHYLSRLREDLSTLPPEQQQPIQHALLSALSDIRPR